MQKCSTESGLTVEESNTQTCDNAKRRRREKSFLSAFFLRTTGCESVPITASLCVSHCVNVSVLIYVCVRVCVRTPSGVPGGSSWEGLPLFSCHQ